MLKIGPKTLKKEVVSRMSTNQEEYAELTAQVRATGLLESQPVFYILNVLGILLGLGSSLTILILAADTLWIQLLNALFLAVVFTQVGLFGHDTTHGQVSHTPWIYKSLLLSIVSLIGLDPSWWIDKHVRKHHAKPNSPDDEDMNVITLAFSKKQALEKKGRLRLLVAYQAFYFIPQLCLSALGFRGGSITYLLRKGTRILYPLAERFLLVSHFAVYLGLIFWLLNPWHAALFIVTHHLLFGFYMGSVFAPNHKGMLIVEEGSELQDDFLRYQILTARNVTSNWFTDFWYGMLNYQIEHHLFPNMPRRNLPKAAVIVKQYCLDHGIRYHKTSIRQSVKEILGSFHEASAPLREKKGAATLS